MDRESYDKLTVEEILQRRDFYKQKVEINSKLKELEKLIEPLKAEQEKISNEIDGFIEKIEDATDEEKIDLYTALADLKGKMNSINEKLSEHESLKEEYENQIDNLNNPMEKKDIEVTLNDNELNNPVEKNDTGVITFNNNKLNNSTEIIIVINKNDGIKITKKQALDYSSKEKKSVSLSEKAKGIFAVAAAKLKTKLNQAKEWVKEDLKKGVVYNTVQTVKEAMPEIKEATTEAIDEIKEKTVEVKEQAKLKINKAKSAIAKTTKKSVGFIKSSYDKIATKVNDVRTVVVAKSQRFANITKAVGNNVSDYAKQSLEDRRKRLQELSDNIKASLSEPELVSKPRTL